MLDNSACGFAAVNPLLMPPPHKTMARRTPQLTITAATKRKESASSSALENFPKKQRKETTTPAALTSDVSTSEHEISDSFGPITERDCQRSSSRPRKPPNHPEMVNTIDALEADPQSVADLHKKKSKTSDDSSIFSPSPSYKSRKPRVVKPRNIKKPDSITVKGKSAACQDLTEGRTTPSQISPVLGRFSDLGTDRTPPLSPPVLGYHTFGASAAILSPPLTSPRPFRAEKDVATTASSSRGRLGGGDHDSPTPIGRHPFQNAQSSPMLPRLWICDNRKAISEQIRCRDRGIFVKPLIHVLRYMATELKLKSSDGIGKLRITLQTPQVRIIDSVDLGNEEQFREVKQIIRKKMEKQWINDRNDGHSSEVFFEACDEAIREERGMQTWEDAWEEDVEEISDAADAD
ncbi:hypothetical protein MMC25_007193 [Agyrium rufum]|nr:hypothetical protein [Agyrium rufum]